MMNWQYNFHGLQLDGHLILDEKIDTIRTLQDQVRDEFLSPIE